MSDAKKTDEGDVAAPPKAKSKMLLFIIIGVVVLALVGGGAVFMLMKKKAPADGEEGDEEVVAEEAHGKKDDKHAAPVFVKLDTFTVRLQNEGQDSYLQVVPELRVLDAHIGETVKQYNPEIRHKALLIMAAKTPAELNTPAGVEALANELRVTINAILAPPAPKKKGKKKEEEPENTDHAGPNDPIQAVLFTSFIVQ